MDTVNKIFNSVGEKPRLRAPAFTNKEDEALIKTYFKYRNIIRGKNATGVSQRTRNEAWDLVALAVNDADGRYHRTMKSVKIHYGNMLAEYKAYKSNDKNARTFQDNQVFYKYFDELLTEREGTGSSDGNDEHRPDNFDVQVSNDEKMVFGSNNFSGNLFELDTENVSEITTCLNANCASEIVDSINSSVFERFLALQSDIIGHQQPDKLEKNENSMLLSLNGNKQNSIPNKKNNFSKTVTKTNKLAQAPSFLINNVNGNSFLEASSNLHKKVAKRKQCTLKIKIFERQLEVLEKKSILLEKKSELIDLQIQREIMARVPKRQRTASSQSF